MLKIETKDYDSPSTRRTIVDLEDGVCAGSVRVINEAYLETKAIDNQLTNESFDHHFENPNWEETSTLN